MAAFVLSNAVGLVRQMLIARTFGTGPEVDAFGAAQRLPDILFNLVAGGALASAFIPTFTGFLTRDDHAGAWRLASGVVNLVFLILVAVSLLAAIFAPSLVQATFGFPPEQQTLTVRLLRILLLQPAIFGISGLLMGILNAHQYFLLPALAPTFLWLGMIFGLVALTPSLGIFGLAWGAVLGAVLHLAVQLPGLGRLKQARYQLELGRHNPAVREVVRLMGPRLVGVAAVQLNFLVTTILATHMGEGSLAAVTYAWPIFTLPQVVIAQSISIAALPTFSAMAARGALDEMRDSLADTVRGILFLALPATVGLLALGTPVVAMLYEGHSFDAESTALVAWALVFFTLGLVSHSVVEIISRAYYALKDTRTPVAIGAAAMGLNIILSLALAPLFTRLGLWPHGALALANTVATTLEMVVLVGIMRGRLHGLALRRVWAGLWRTLAASALMATALAVWVPATTGRSSWILGLGGVAVGGAVYGVSALLLRAPEVEGVRRRWGKTTTDDGRQTTDV